MCVLVNTAFVSLKRPTLSIRVKVCLLCFPKPALNCTPGTQLTDVTFHFRLSTLLHGIMLSLGLYTWRQVRKCQMRRTASGRRHRSCAGKQGLLLTHGHPHMQLWRLREHCKTHFRNKAASQVPLRGHPSFLAEAFPELSGISLQG